MSRKGKSRTRIARRNITKTRVHKSNTRQAAKSYDRRTYDGHGSGGEALTVEA